MERKLIMSLVANSNITYDLDFTNKEDMLSKKQDQVFVRTQQ